MIKNKTGSILSSAIIVIVLLSFTLTTVSAYTFNVATRTNEIVRSSDENQFARGIINNAIGEMQSFLNEQMEGSDSIEEDFANALNMLEETKIDSIIDDNEDIIKAFYDFNFGIDEARTTGLTIELLNPEAVGETTISREYRISFEKENGRVLFRNLLLALSSDTAEEIENQIEYDDFEDIFQDLLDILDPEEDGLDCGNSCTDQFRSEFADNPSGQTYTVNRDLYIDVPPGEVFTISPSGAGDSTTLNLNGNILLVKGNFLLDGIHILELGGGLIIVENNFEIIARHDIVHSDVTVIVGGEFNVTAMRNHRGNIQGGDKKLVGQTSDSYFHYLSFNTNNGGVENIEQFKTRGDDLNPLLSDTFYDYCFTENGGELVKDIGCDHNGGRYAGSDDAFPGLSWIVREYGNLLDIDGSNVGRLYESAVGAFEEE